MSIKSELTKTASYLKSARNAIAGRGGEISATAGLKDLPMAIFNIPADSSLGFYSDNTVAYKKTTLANAKEKILLNEIGGMTYKSENHLNPAFFDATKEIASGLTITNNGDGSITINGDGYVTLYDMDYTMYNGTRFNADGMYLSIDKPLPENLAILALSYPTNEEGNYQYETFYWIHGDVTSVALSGWVESIVITRDFEATSDYVVADNITIKPMLSRGSVKPYEPYYEGLRDSKVTALKVYGANLLDVSKCVNKCFVGNGDGTYTIKGVGTDRFSEWASVQIPANTYFYVAAKTVQEASKIINIQAKLADGTTPTIRGLSEAIASKKFTSDIVGIRFYIQGSGTSADGVSGVYSDFWLSLANVGYYPYKAEPTTYAIPEAVQALSGYGEGNPYNTSEYNTVNFENQIFIKKGAISSGEWESFTTPEITDISVELAGFDPFIYVEPTGDIEFVNEYENAVPSKITYIVKAGS